MTRDFPCPPALGDDLLKRYQFFELYPLDGGGRFITQELFGTLDDAIITRKILTTNVLEEFGGLDELDFGRFERWRTIEKSCWLNRFYFLVPMARTAWLTGDPALAARVMKVMLRFHRHCPPPADVEAHWRRVERRMKEDYNSRSVAEIAADETDVEYIWFDMQVGQRLISFLHAGYFIWRSPGITDAERAELLRCLTLHARILTEQERFQTPYCDNHQSLRGAALYAALDLLRGDPGYADAEALARELCEWHLRHEFLPGGMLFEYSPSYHAFVLWHARDFRLFAHRRGAVLQAESEERFAAAVRVLSCFLRPDGETLTLNDSYVFDPAPLLASLGASARPPQAEAVVPGTLAAASCGGCYLALDISGFVGKFSHYHGGKLAPVVLWHGTAFLEEAGSPSYDAPEFPLCKKPEWHSSLLVDGAGDTHQFGLYGFDGWAEVSHDEAWECGGGTKRFSAQEVSNVPEWAGVVWRRTALLSGSGVSFRDEIAADRPHRCTLLFDLAPGVAAAPEEDFGRWRLVRDGHTAFFSVSGDVPVRIGTAVTGCCRSGGNREALQLRCSFDVAARCTVTTALTFAENS